MRLPWAFFAVAISKAQTSLLKVQLANYNFTPSEEIPPRFLWEEVGIDIDKGIAGRRGQAEDKGDAGEGMVPAG